MKSLVKRKNDLYKFGLKTLYRNIVYLKDMLSYFSYEFYKKIVMFIFELRNIIKIFRLAWFLKLQNQFAEAVWRLAVVKLNKAPKCSVQSPNKVLLCKFPLWDLWLLAKHCTEMNLFTDKKQIFMLVHMYNINMVTLRPYK